MSRTTMLRGGEYATSNRTRTAEVCDFIWAKAAAGTPHSAIAKMLGRHVADVTSIIRSEVADPAQCRTPGESTRDHTLKTSITRVVAKARGFTVAQLRGPEGGKALYLARQEAYALIYATGRFSDRQIGQYFGGRDGSTICHGRQRHAMRQATQ